MTDYTSKWIAEREQLEAAATPGPWSAADEYGDISGSDYLWCVSQMRPGFEAMPPTEGYVGDVAEVGDSEADAEFIADARSSLPTALAALKAVLTFATAERDKISRTYIAQPDTAYAGYANAMDDVICTIEAALRGES